MNANQNQVQAPVMNPNITGKIMARKPDVYDGETSIDDWVDSMKAYIEGTNPGSSKSVAYQTLHGTECFENGKALLERRVL